MSSLLYRSSSSSVVATTTLRVRYPFRSTRHRVCRRLRALLHQLRRQEQDGTLDPARLAEARGRLAYLRMLNAGQAEALLRQAPGALES